MITDAGLAEPDTETVLIGPGEGSAAGTLDRSEARVAAAEVQERMSALPEVERVRDPVWAEDGQHVLVPVDMAESSADDAVTALQDVTAGVAASHPGLQVSQAGGESIDAAIWERVAEDLGAAERLSLPITFAVLLVAFGALLAAGIPLLLALSGVVATMGIYAPLSYLVPDGGTVANVVLLIGLAVGVDYSLFYLKREREERRAGRSTVDAIEIAAATSGHSVVVSGLAVMVAMSGLFVVQDAGFSAIAAGTIIVVAVAVIGSLTVLPAVLSRLGRWVDRPRVPLLWRLNRRIGAGGISRRLLAPVLRHPVASLTVSVLAVGALAVPAVSMRMEESGLSALPHDIPEVQTMLDVQDAFPAEGSTYEVAARTSPEDLPAAESALRELEDSAVDAGFEPVAGRSIRTAADDGVAVLTLGSAATQGSEESRTVLSTLRSSLAPAALDGVDADWAVGGDAAESADFLENQTSKLPWVIGFVLGLTLLMMAVTFRSVLLALLTTALNLASVAVAFGVLALVFEHSWAESLLDFTSSGYVISWIPLFLFVILVGLSMDYHVFVLSRIREGLRRGLSHREAVETGIVETAGVVTSAAAVMVSVFAIFATLSMLEMKQMGVGLAVAVLVDATLVRVVMLPALLLLFGRAAWWPGGAGRQQSVPPIARPEVAHPVGAGTTTG
jgi:RND superfamily putative drug exporter